MEKEMVDTVEEYVRLKCHENWYNERKQNLMVIHRAIWKIKLQMEGRTNGN